ncbi:glucose-6-phosphate isomerase [Campylobacter sp. MIT 97-5078]|uniref:glucose-6-phosphate isomerase n=1 Tax=Campylobacter sp. MIT 97-5078 TaxID=1548153 RepID=UPI0005133F8E|nr:glucose-6-phosphate isomerase [Campylobacter sp. MIT 97-5078]KGI55553.1 glucose-6-phosphate isomerase [Campylobacter sp. MIT 97-5078]KGI57770.1 glucose-6-phosphate isomerase [Campylobacter sp. MIT 97-5078]TQR23059.1 glucose-6-phosphate isomerase [Campylobacter sp. MIT 97-5078]
MSLTQLSSFIKLKEHFEQMKNIHMKTMFEEDENRAKRYFLSVADLRLDYSKNRINDETLKLLFELANERNLKEKIKAMFRGDKINTTENRSVLHTALRNRGEQKIEVEGVDVMQNVRSVLEKMEKFCDQISIGSWLGYNNHFITDIVNIGIGGSDLGALMVCKALKEYGNPRLNMHFVSNVDSTQLQGVLSKIHPQTTLFIIASKTFSTQETLTNAFAARKWFLDSAVNECFIAKHFVAVSTNKKAALEFGIAEDNIFEFWNWVGGRYSLWCAVGLAIMLYLGKDNFYTLLEGAYIMDRHFYESEFEQNMPVILGLLGIWYINFFKADTHLIMPYDEHLRHFPKFIQQLDMESNGKQITKDGTFVDYDTGPIVLGDMGINAQHAFFQLLHQGTRLAPIDLIAVLSKKGTLPKHHEILLSNVFAQARAFMVGKTYEEVCEELTHKNMPQTEIEKLALHKVFKGNRVSNTLLLDELNPKSIGSLIALYEHKIFVQGAIWDINSFDQWGVELGKELAKSILAELLGQDTQMKYDSSTKNLIELYKQKNQS